MQIKDNRCFEYALLLDLHYYKIERDAHRPTKYYTWLNTLSFNGIKFQVEWKEKVTSSIESLNNLAINIFIMEMIK